MDGSARPRWGQLTYSSFDRHDGRGGGWQIKNITGDLDEVETELLRGAVETQFDAGVELPRFPTPAQVEELPRRLVYAPAGDHGETALWHHVPAGTDASGRPGNVFAHVVLDRHPDVADPIRPIERWRSDDWLTPFGVDAVMTAELTSPQPPAPGPLRRQTIASWLFAPRQWRMHTLTVLLDAISQAMGGAPMVVLGADDVDEAANWIAAISFAMSPGTARRFHFSTLERPSGLTAARRRTLHLACVPRRDLADLAKRDGIVVIDPQQRVSLGDLDGEPHRTARGDRVPAGEWSALITEVFADARAMVRAVGEFDRIAHTLGDAGLDAAWPAAMLISRDANAGARSEASRVLATWAPPQLRSVPELFATAVTALRTQAAGDVTEAWAHVRKVGADAPNEASATVAGEVAVLVYAELALAAPKWLEEPGPARIPSAHYYSPTPEPDLVRIAARQAVRLVARSGPLEGAGADAAVVAKARAGLHLVELALRLGLAHDDALAAPLWQICQQLVLPVLCDHTRAGVLLQSVGHSIAQETRHWLWSQLDVVDLTGLGPPGRRLAQPVLAVLGPGPDDPDPLVATWTWLRTADPAASVITPLIGEYAWYRNRDHDDSLDARFLAAWSAIDAYARSGDRRVLADTSGLLTPAWPTERLALLHAAFTTAVPGEWYLRHLLEAPADGAATALWTQVADRPDRPRIADLAQRRIFLAADEWIRLCEPRFLVDDMAQLADALRMARKHGMTPDSELLRRIEGTVVLGLLSAKSRVLGVDPRKLEAVAGQVQAAIAAWPEALVGFTAAEADNVVDWCDEHAVTTRALVELLLLADPRSALRNENHRVAGWLHEVRTGDPDSPPITALVIAARVRRDTAGGDDVSEQVLAAARTAPGSTDDRASRAAERFLAGWLRQVQTGKVRR